MALVSVEDRWKEESVVKRIIGLKIKRDGGRARDPVCQKTRDTW